MANSSTPILDRPALESAAAAELMTPGPLSLRDDATLTEAIAFLADKGFSAAPVIDAAGKPIGVISRTDIVVHERQEVARGAGVHDYYGRSDLTTDPEAAAPLTGTVAPIRVRDLMTPAIFSVTPEVSARQVAEQLVALNVHRLFVVDRTGVLVGVVTALDVLRFLCGGAAAVP